MQKMPFGGPAQPCRPALERLVMTGGRYE